ncbi:NUDIX hydrolase [Patulibacter minatonensis]|uniref:NUDIX hydrolase n=1 Tax=Patulibacter minatonensis TaxID=298163 RepID=UPI00047898AE|nr:CoA pyrophosphatase [Patulibacter minatonensis]
MQHPTRNAVTDRLRAFRPRTLPLPEGTRRAAVVLAIVDDGEELGLWITRRAARMRAHPGQWAIPGGRLEAGETDVAAGLRELGEELGVHLGEDAVLGRLDDYETRSGFVITPVVAWAGRPAEPPVPNPAEVDELHLLTLDALDVEPLFHEIPESDRPVVQLPILDDLIHAPTAAILHQFREVALHGRDTRVAEFEQPVFAWR